MALSPTAGFAAKDRLNSDRGASPLRLTASLPFNIRRVFKQVVVNGSLVVDCIWGFGWDARYRVTIHLHPRGNQGGGSLVLSVSCSYGTAGNISDTRVRRHLKTTSPILVSRHANALYASPSTEVHPLYRRVDSLPVISNGQLTMLPPHTTQSAEILVDDSAYWLDEGRPGHFIYLCTLPTGRASNRGPDRGPSNCHASPMRLPADSSIARPETLLGIQGRRQWCPAKGATSLSRTSVVPLCEELIRATYSAHTSLSPIQSSSPTIGDLAPLNDSLLGLRHVNALIDRPATDTTLYQGAGLLLSIFRDAVLCL
ncbi:hypothetical protein NMY22_g13569 [Coprinellus aureogranulatus]|nr:hypothetical protein NMY22_g13569 [Coprinellus aureogranulatus]